MAEWCQNKDCAKKKTQSQIRGSKGSKYYQSNKAHAYYYNMFCSQRCFHNWFTDHNQTCLNVVGEIGKQTVQVDDDWSVEYVSSYRSNNDTDEYYLINKLQGIKQRVTRDQAQTPEQQEEEYSEWRTINDDQAKELAISLGLAK